MGLYFGPNYLVDTPRLPARAGHGGFLPETIIRIPPHIFSPKLMAIYFKLLKVCATIHILPF